MLDPVVPAKQLGRDSSDVGHQEGPPGDSGAPHSWPGRRDLANSLAGARLGFEVQNYKI